MSGYCWGEMCPEYRRCEKLFPGAGKALGELCAEHVQVDMLQTDAPEGYPAELVISVHCGALDISPDTAQVDTRMETK